MIRPSTAPYAHLYVVAETARQIVEDVSNGIRSGLLNDDLTQARKIRVTTAKARSYPSRTVAQDHEALEAAQAFFDGRMEFLCELIAVHCPGASLSVGWLRRQAVQLGHSEHGYKGLRKPSFAIGSEPASEEDSFRS